MVQNSFIVPTTADNKLMVVTGYTSVTLPDTINTFIINVSLGDRVKYNDIPSSVFGNNTTCFFLYYCFSGILGPVTNISSSIDKCSNIYITWDSPEVEDDRVSILYYLLTICDNINGIIVDNYTVYDTNYQFEDQDLFIHRYTYIIAGVNELGKGISNMNTFSYQRGIYCHYYYINNCIHIVPKSARESTLFYIMNFIENNANITFNIPVSTLNLFCCFILILGNSRVYW